MLRQARWRGVSRPGMVAENAMLQIREAASRMPALDLLVLHGSRARGDAHSASDWDFAYIARTSFRPEDLMVDLSGIVATDAVDLVDLERASGLLRFRAARDGVSLCERVPGAFDRFRFEAVRFWCDAGPTLEQSYAAVLARLEP